jgi:hypothetical protein
MTVGLNSYWVIWKKNKNLIIKTFINLNGTMYKILLTRFLNNRNKFIRNSQ